MTRTLTSLAALALLAGCSSDSSAPASTTTPTASTPATQQPGAVTPLPTPATPPATTTAPNRVETSFFGVLGDQIQETTGIVSRLWVISWSWDGNLEAKLAGIVAAGLPCTFDLDEWLYEGTSLRADAEQRVRYVAARLVDSGADRYVDSVTCADEPNLRERDLSDTVPQAVALMRKVFPDKRMRVIYSDAYPWCYPELFDDVGADNYRAGDGVVLPGRDFEGNPTACLADQWLKKLRPGQGLILPPGGADLAYSSPTPQRWVEYAQVQAALGRRVEICAFAFRAPPDAAGLLGICDQPALRAQYEAAFRSAIT